ncbi:MAG: hypothetical protein R3B99_17360 [Polyangiales bacterium]
MKARLGMDDVAALESYEARRTYTILAHGVQLRAAEMKRMRSSARVSCIARART